MNNQRPSRQFPSSYPPTTARSDMATRYRMSAPPVGFGHVTRPGSSVPGGASRHDPYRTAYATTRPPVDSPFNTQRQDYKRQEDRARDARTRYWNHNAAYDQNTSGARYHQQGQSYAHNAAIQTHKAIKARQSFMQTYPAYDPYDSYQGHQQRVNNPKDKEADMKCYKAEHRNGARDYSSSSKR